jgi:branched-chain amino acid transport system ATP-binding protein
LVSLRIDQVSKPVSPLLQVEDLQAWYGESHILHGLSFDVDAGRVVTLLGRNGAGKSTCLKALIGALPKRAGSIRFRGQEIAQAAPGKIARLGMAWCPEDRGIFASLTVKENLLLPPVLTEGGMPLDEIMALFPNLATRLHQDGTKLSGGEQQMLAIARILRTGANLLLLDEPTEGLAPVIVKQIESAIARLKARGYTIILVEQNFHFAAEVADEHYIVELGHIVDRVVANEVSSSISRIHGYLGI